jgi:hypothetical protein
MKVNRTYTMELKTLELLARKKNKSLIVNTAVKKYFSQEDVFTLESISSNQLRQHLYLREDTPEILKLVLDYILRNNL